MPRTRCAAPASSSRAPGTRWAMAWDRRASVSPAYARTISHRAHDLRDRTRGMRHQAMDMQGSAVQFLSEQPLVAAALAFAAGAALGAALPATSKENELIGETADQVKARIKDAAEPLVSQAKDVIDDVVEEGKTRPQRHHAAGQVDPRRHPEAGQGRVRPGPEQAGRGPEQAWRELWPRQGDGDRGRELGDLERRSAEVRRGGNAGQHLEPPISGTSSDQSSGYGTTPSGTPGQRW